MKLFSIIEYGILRRDFDMAANDGYFSDDNYGFNYE